MIQHETLVTFAVYVFSTIEIIFGMILIIYDLRPVKVTAVCSLLVFIIYLSYKVITNDPNSCGCMGGVLLMTHTQSLIQDLFYLSVGIYIL
ncbi:MauE/DoxX family redox-associated membrane protein [candidate division KSB1 bacterium]